jgi:hypothetical protein
MDLFKESTFGFMNSMVFLFSGLSAFKLIFTVSFLLLTLGFDGFSSGSWWVNVGVGIRDLSSFLLYVFWVPSDHGFPCTWDRLRFRFPCLRGFPSSPHGILGCLRPGCSVPMLGLGKRRDWVGDGTCGAGVVGEGRAGLG